MAEYKKLEQAGIDMEQLLRRLMGNEALIRVFIKKFSEDQTYGALQSAFAEKDMKKAEMMSHTLKGMCGNLSLNKLYRLFTDQVDLLRSGEQDKAEAMMGEIAAEFEGAISAMAEWMEEKQG